MGRLRACHPSFHHLMPFLSLLKDNLSHPPLASYRSGEIFTQDVRPEQLLEGKVRPLLGYAVGLERVSRGDGG